jgi:predicted esterase
MRDLKIEEIEQQYHRLAAAGAYAEALKLATREADRWPDYDQPIIYYWRMLMACRVNKAALALQLLQEAVEAGYWLDGLREEADFQTLRGNPEFERLVERCEDRRAAAMASAVPVLKTLQPEHATAPYPWLLALHGNPGTVESFAGHWAAAVTHGWFVGLPQSSQAHGPGTFSWNDIEWATLEVQKHFAAICRQYPVDPRRAVMAGFSMGAGLALWLVLNDKVKVRGLVLVAPFLPEVDRLIPVLEARQANELRAYLVASDDDPYCHEVARKLAILLPRYGIGCEIETYPHLGHSFPPPFESRLPAALEYVLRS